MGGIDDKPGAYPEMGAVSAAIGASAADFGAEIFTGHVSPCNNASKFRQIASRIHERFRKCLQCHFLKICYRKLNLSSTREEMKVTQKQQALYLKMEK